MITEFGKAVRKARIESGENITSMANELKVSPAFISSIETGKKKVPAKTTEAIIQFFSRRCILIENIKELADIQNGFVSINNLPYKQKLLISMLSRNSIDETTISDIIDNVKGELNENMESIQVL